MPTFRVEPSKFYRYACTKSSRRVSLGPIRQGLSDQGPSRTPSPRRVRVRVSGETRARQKEIGNIGNLPAIPYLCNVFVPLYRPHGIMTAPPGFVRAGFFICYADSAPGFAPPIPADSCTYNRTRTNRRKSRFPLGNGPSSTGPIHNKIHKVRFGRHDATPVRTSGQCICPQL